MNRSIVIIMLVLMSWLVYRAFFYGGQGFLSYWNMSRNDGIAAAKTYETDALVKFLRANNYRIRKGGEINLDLLRASVSLTPNEVSARKVDAYYGSHLPSLIKCLWNISGTTILDDRNGLVDSIDIVGGINAMIMHNISRRGNHWWQIDVDALELATLNKSVKARLEERQHKSPPLQSKIDRDWQVRARWIEDMEWLPLDKTGSPAFTYTYDLDMYSNIERKAVLHRRVIVVIGANYPVFLTSSRFELAGETKPIKNWQDLWHDFKFDEGYAYQDRDHSIGGLPNRTLQDELVQLAFCE